MENKKIFECVLNTWGLNRLVYLTTCGVVGLGVGMLVGLLSMHNIPYELKEKGDEK